MVLPAQARALEQHYASGQRRTAPAGPSRRLHGAALQRALLGTTNQWVAELLTPAWGGRK